MELTGWALATGVIIGILILIDTLYGGNDW
jgi:hypothetical protein